ncbi:MAG: hypothetical protein QW815_06340 [Nitrososphaerota archaeon]
MVLFMVRGELEVFCRELSDEHDYIFGIPLDEVSYGVTFCEVCNSRIDEFGYCACGGWPD